MENYFGKWITILENEKSFWKMENGFFWGNPIGWPAHNFLENGKWTMENRNEIFIRPGSQIRLQRIWFC